MEVTHPWNFENDFAFANSNNNQEITIVIWSKLTFTLLIILKWLVIIKPIFLDQ